MRSVLALLIVSLSNCDVAAQKLQIPDEDRFVALRPTVEDVVEEIFQKYSSTETEQAIDELIELAVADIDPARRYCVLEKSLDAAMAVGDGVSAIRCLKNILEQFEGFEPDYDVDRVRKILSGIESPQQEVAVIGEVFGLARRHLAAKEFDAAHKICEHAIRYAPSRRVPFYRIPVLESVAKLRSLIKGEEERHSVYESAIERLAVEPDNSRAHSVVGLYEILVNDKLRDGLDHLDGSDDPRLTEIQRLESLLFQTDEDFHALAEAWWQLGEDLEGRAQRKARELSHDHYRECFENLTGVDKVAAKKRIEEFLDGDKIAYVVHDLLRPDLRRSIRHGNMNPAIGKLTLTSSGIPSSCQFFQRMSDDYDLNIAFTRSHDLTYAFFFGFPSRGRVFTFANSGQSANNHTVGMQGPLGPLPNTKLGVQPDQRYTLKIQMRQGRMEVQLDGKVLVNVYEPCATQPAGRGAIPGDLFSQAFPFVGDWWGTLTLDLATVTEYR